MLTEAHLFLNNLFTFGWSLNKSEQINLNIIIVLISRTIFSQFERQFLIIKTCGKTRINNQTNFQPYRSSRVTKHLSSRFAIKPPILI